MRILIADDSATARLFLRQCLEVIMAVKGDAE